MSRRSSTGPAARKAAAVLLFMSQLAAAAEADSKPYSGVYPPNIISE